MIQIPTWRNIYKCLHLPLFQLLVELFNGRRTPGMKPIGSVTTNIFLAKTFFANTLLEGTSFFTIPRYFPFYPLDVFLVCDIIPNRFLFIALRPPRQNKREYYLSFFPMFFKRFLLDIFMCYVTFRYFQMRAQKHCVIRSFIMKVE